jgi:hypothetical protein
LATRRDSNKKARMSGTDKGEELAKEEALRRETLEKKEAQAEENKKLARFIKEGGYYLLQLAGVQVILDGNHEPLDPADPKYGEISELINPIRITEKSCFRTPTKTPSRVLFEPKTPEATEGKEEAIAKPQEDAEVPIPENLIKDREIKVIKSTMDEALKTGNAIPKATESRETWHLFLSRFHAQWTAIGWPNTDSTAMHLSSKLGSDEVLRWVQGHNLQEYLYCLNYSMAKGDPLRETNSLVTFALAKDRHLVQNWTVFTYQAASEAKEKIPLVGNQQLRKLFEQKIKGTVFAEAWSNVKLVVDVCPDGTNWLKFIKRVEADHKYPKMETKVERTKSSTQLNLSHKGAEYRQAQEIVDQGGQCPACNEFQHKIKACWLIKLFKEVRAHVFQKENVPKRKFYCLLHGHTDSHDTEKCFSIRSMGRNPQRYKEILDGEKDKPLSERSGRPYANREEQPNQRYHPRRVYIGKEDDNKDELEKKNKELKSRVLTLDLKKRNRELETQLQLLEKPVKKLKGCMKETTDSEELITVTVPKKSLNFGGFKED